LPKWDEVRQIFQQGPAGKPAMGISGWDRVCFGYQPALARGWMVCTQIFAEESMLDKVFKQDLFWVITRATDCFY
jgi:hypothetical protein